MAKGIIYVMSTVVDGLIKIGKTGSNNFESRMYNLEHDGYRNVVGLRRQFAIEVDDYDEKERLLDNIFSKSQVPNTELFALDIQLVIQLLSSFEGRVVYPPCETKDEIFDEAVEKARTTETPKVQRREPFKFSMIGLKPGDKVYHYTPATGTTGWNQIAIVSDDKHVEYEGEITSLTALAKKLENTENALQGPYHFTIDGKESLDDLRKRNDGSAPDIAEAKQPIQTKHEKVKSGEAVSPKKKNRPPFHFSMIGMNPRDTIYLIPDNSVIATVCDDDRHVLYNGETVSLSTLADRFVSSKTGVAGTLYFSRERGSKVSLSEERERLEKENN